MNNDTICAIATAQGGAIGIIRVSGNEAISIVGKIFKCAGKSLSERDANSITFGRIVAGNGEVIDEVLVSLFRAPHSYTGEDAVEISCHGSQYILQQVMQLLLKNGGRQAERGEFTQRAFLNGKMDLAQAEAVADLIASSSASTHRMAMSQMRGDFSRGLSSLRERLLKLTSLMELELDFSDHEELEFADRHELTSLSAEIETVISRLANSFSLGNALKNGVPVAIIGETNAGKSTLLNALVGEERAIVSDIHGTTRDVIEDTLNIDGILFRFIDTAGIRETHDQIETLGIERTFKKINEAQIVIWLVDATCVASQIEELAPRLLPLCKDKTLIVAYNKIDTIEPPKNFEDKDIVYTLQAYSLHLQSFFQNLKALQTLTLSAKTGEGIPSLKQLLLDAVSPSLDQGEDIIVSNLRHYEALTHALDAIHRVQDGLTSSLPTDLVAQDLRDCLAALADITGGAITSQETLSNIFKNFCIGK